MLLWKKLKMLNSDLGKRRARESRLLEEICHSNDYTEVKEKLESIINYFYFLPSLDERTKDTSFLEWMIYKFRFMSVYGETYDIKQNAEYVLFDMERQGESNFSLENILNIYYEGLNERKKDAIKYIIFFILGAFCLSAPFVGVISDLFINLCSLALGTILTYKSLSYIRLSSIKSINKNQKIIMARIDDIHIEKVRTELKGHIKNDTLSKGNGNQLSKQLPNSFNGEPIKERPGRGQGPMSRTRKPGKQVEK